MKAKTPLESEVLREICEWLEHDYYFFWRCNNIPVFGMNNAGKRTFRALPKYTPRGLPDIMVIHNGTFIAFEVKREGAKLRDEQEVFKDNCNAHGGIYLVAHSQAEAYFHFKRLGFERKDV